MRLKRQEKRDNWLLIKERDDAARDEPEDADEKEEADGRPDDRSVVSGRTLAELSAPATETVASISGARRADMAEFVAPQLAMAGSRPPKARAGCMRSSSTATAPSPASTRAGPAFSPATASTGPTATGI